MRLGEPMPAVQVRAILQVLCVSEKELAHEIGASERTVRRWLESGCDGANAATLRLLHRIHDLGLAWQHGSVRIGFGPDGMRILNDVEAVADRARMRGL